MRGSGRGRSAIGDAASSSHGSGDAPDDFAHSGDDEHVSDGSLFGDSHDGGGGRLEGESWIDYLKRFAEDHGIFDHDDVADEEPLDHDGIDIVEGIDRGHSDHGEELFPGRGGAMLTLSEEE